MSNPAFPLVPANSQSPTPSEPDVERRQEDMNQTLPSSPPPGENGAVGEAEDGDADMVDLDGDMEDMDDDNDGEGEGDDGEQDLGEDFIDEDSDGA